MPSFFPAQYPDELVYSVLARYHVRSGNTSPKMTIKELFDKRTITAVVDMPGCIDILVNRFQDNSKIDALDLIKNNTLFPYYAAFQPDNRVRAIITAMRGNGAGSLHVMSGITASPIKVPEYLRFCPICVENDRKRYGELFWHRLHQIPGVFFCPIHDAPIYDSIVNLNIKYRHEYVAASDLNCILKQTLIYNSTKMEKLKQVSKDIDWVIHNYEIVRKAVSSDVGLVDSYLSLLKEKNIATINGRIYQDRLIYGFVDHYGDELLEELQSAVKDSRDNWLSGIVRSYKKSFHPIRHILLMQYLCSSAENFFKNIKAYNPFGKGPWFCLNPAADHYMKPVVKDIEITHCSDTKLPVGTFKCTCGFVYSRRGPDKVRGDAYKIGRIKSFGFMWEEKFRSLVEGEKLGLRETARHLKVDPGTVKSYSKKLGLKARWNTVDSRPNMPLDDSCRHSGIDFYRLLEQHRLEWTTAVSNNPDVSKTEIRNKAKSDYIWLYKHDRKWLCDNSPTIKSIRIIRSRVNWEYRDEKVREKVQVAVNGMLNTDEKPIRISVSRIGKETGLLGLLEKNLNKMPETKVYIESVIETSAEYRKRRFVWAVQQLKNSGIEPKLWNIMRKAGIRKEYASEIGDFYFTF